MKVKNTQMATNIKIKGTASGGSGAQVTKHAHNQSVSVVQNQNAFAKGSIGSIENLNQAAAAAQGAGSKKIQMHAKHQSLNTRANNGQNNSVIINGANNNNAS